MADYVHLDSTYRDRQQYPNPFNYVVSATKCSGWCKQPRQVKALGGPQPSTQEFAVSIRPLEMTLPYSTAMTSVPYVYVDVHGKTYNDENLVRSINDSIKPVRFVFTNPSVQYDNNGVGKWIRFYSSMEQVMRFKRDDDLVVKIMDRSLNPFANPDNAIPNPLNPLAQTYLTFCLTPYIRDASFTNQNANFIATS